MTLFQVIAGTILAASLVGTLVVLQSRRISLRGGVLLSVVWVAGCVLVFSPSTATSIATWFGIGRGADFVLYTGLLIGIYAGLVLFVRLRKLEVLVTRLAREEAIRTAKLAQNPAPEGPATASVDSDGR